MKLSEESQKEVDAFVGASLKALTDAVSGTTKIVGENAPLIAKDIVLDYMLSNVTSLFLSLAFFIPALLKFCQLMRIENLTHDQGFGVLGCSVVIVLSGVCATCSFYSVLKAKLMPRLIVFDYVKSMLKGGQ